MILPYYQLDKSTLKLHLKVIPNSSKNEICGIVNDADGQQMLKVKITQQPEDGKANKALIKFLAKFWDIKASDIEIISGKTSRNKRILMQNAHHLFDKLEK